MRNTPAIPTTGRNTTKVSPHESNQFIGREPLRSVRDPQDDAEQRDPGEHDECVPLQTPGLDGPGGAARVAGPDRQPVDDTVDSALVEDVVREPGNGARPSPH